MERGAVLDLLAAYVALGLVSTDEARALYAAWEAGDPATRDGDLFAVVGTDDLALALLLLGGILAGVRLFDVLRRRLAPSLAERALRAATGSADTPPAEIARRAVAASQGAREAAVRAMLAPPSGDGQAGNASAVRAVLSEASRLAASPDVRAVTRAAEILMPPAPGRDALARELLDIFDGEADRRAALLFAAPDDTAADRRSRGSLPRFQTGMRLAAVEDLATQARLGAGRALTADEERDLARRSVEAVRYVDGLAGRVATDRAGLTKPLTEKQVAAALRRTLGGEIGGAFWRALAGTQGPGVVLHFEGFDALPDGTRGHCTPCLDAERGSPYLPDDPALPIPGLVCLGGGHCRHHLRPEVNPAEYARLTAAPTRQAA